MRKLRFRGLGRKADPVEEIKEYVSGTDEQKAVKTVMALLLAPKIALEVLDDGRPDSEREAILWCYLRDLVVSLPLETALAVGSAALEDAREGSGKLFFLWHAARQEDKEPSLDAMIADCGIVKEVKT